MAANPGAAPVATPSAATETIPEHLRQYVAAQNPDLYTPIDHAGWRYILKVSKAFFARHAHRKYLDGLDETGISTERIPLISEMDSKLRRFGWRAVPVSGFIPPAAFMEFQSLGILPIACEMRSFEHLAYTPAPDIVHEAAGHAPIIADREYAAYLRAYGEVSRKAIYSSEDMSLYEAIRDLSDVKEDPASTAEQVAAAQKRLDDAIASVHYVSEATHLARMNWWTVEYGLVGDLSAPLIYGAGLLSSVGESYHCLQSRIRKIPLTLDCLNASYDITRPQPQLFVTPDFKTLERILEEVAAGMAFRRGGVVGLAKARMAGTVTTAELDSGVQIGGVLDDFLMDSRGEPVYLMFRGPTQLGLKDREIAGQGPARHPEGFGTPVGTVGGKPPQSLSAADLEAVGFRGTSRGRLRFDSGVEVAGVLEKKGLVLTFRDCEVRLGERVLFKPEWGVFDLACGSRVSSVFGGAPDRTAYAAATGGYRQRLRPGKTNLTDANRGLCPLYTAVRAHREGARADRTLDEVHAELERAWPGDWLLRLELLELNADRKLKAPWAARARQRLGEIAAGDPRAAELVGRGLALLEGGG